jgi:hypothetical protein
MEHEQSASGQRDYRVFGLGTCATSGCIEPWQQEEHVWTLEMCVRSWLGERGQNIQRVGRGQYLRQHPTESISIVNVAMESSRARSSTGQPSMIGEELLELVGAAGNSHGEGVPSCRLKRRSEWPT